MISALTRAVRLLWHPTTPTVDPDIIQSVQTKLSADRQWAEAQGAAADANTEKIRQRRGTYVDELFPPEGTRNATHH